MLTPSFPTRRSADLLRETERGGEVEAADPARHADEAGHHPDLGRKALGHELEHRAIAGAEREHRDNEQDERGGQGRRLRARGERERGDDEEKRTGGAAGKSEALRGALRGRHSHKKKKKKQ